MILVTRKTCWITASRRTVGIILSDPEEHETPKTIEKHETQKQLKKDTAGDKDQAIMLYW